MRFILDYRPDGIILDTNILIVFLLGSYDPASIEFCEIVNNTRKQYSSEDYQILYNLCRKFKKVIVTPQILAELSNLTITNKIKGLTKDSHNLYLQKVLEFLKRSFEMHQDINSIFDLELGTIGAFGLTDLNLVELSKEHNIPVLTDDLELWVYGNAKGPMIKYLDVKYQLLQSEIFA